MLYLLKKHRIVSRELVEFSIQADVLVGGRILWWLSRDFTWCPIRSHIKAAARVVSAIWSCAGGHGSLQTALITPALQVITICVAVSMASIKVRENLRKP